MNKLLKEANRGSRDSYNLLLNQVSVYCHRELTLDLGHIYPAQNIEDITQEVLLAFHTAHQTLDEKIDLEKWIKSIIRIKTDEFLTSKDFILLVDGEEAEMLKGSWILENQQADLNEVLSLFEKLSPHQFEILTLSKVEGFSTKEIADHLNLSDSNVRVIIHRAVKQIRGLVKKK